MKKVILFIGLICLGSFADAQWQQTSLNTGYISCLAVSGKNIFAGSSAGVGIYLTTNNGMNWSQMNNGILYNPMYSQYDNIFTFTISDSSIFAGTSNSVYLSTNNGASWKHLY